MKPAQISRAVGAHALILAAGDSKRMGRPKALLEVDRRSAIRRCVELAHACGCERVVALVAPEIDARTRAEFDARAEICSVHGVPDDRRERGPIGSLAYGLSKLPHEARALLIWPVDHPFVAESTIRALLEAVRDPANAARVVVPLYERRRGHPIAVPAQLVEALREHAGLAGPTLRDFVREHELLEVEVGDAFVRANADTPEEFEALRLSFRAAFPSGNP